MTTSLDKFETQLKSIEVELEDWMNHSVIAHHGRDTCACCHLAEFKEKIDYEIIKDCQENLRNDPFDETVKKYPQLEALVDVEHFHCYNCPIFEFKNDDGIERCLHTPIPAWATAKAKYLTKPTKENLADLTEKYTKVVRFLRQCKDEIVRVISWDCTLMTDERQ